MNDADNAMKPAPAGRPGAPEKGATKQVHEYETGKLGPLLLKFALPAIIGMLCGGIQSIVNRVFVGRACGSTALAGVQIGFPVSTLFMAFAMLVGMGSMTLVAIRLGQQRKDDAERVMGQATVLLFLIPIVIMAIVMPFLDPVLRFIGASETVLPYAHDYFQIFMVGMVFFTPSVGLNNIIRAQGAPNVAMGTQILASAINIVVNYFFVIRLGLGVQGAAMGIVIGNFLSLFWVFGYFMTKNSYLKVRPRYFRIYPHELRVVLSLGVAPFLIQLANSLQQFIMNMKITAYGGDMAVSALSIVMSLSSIAIMPILGFSQGGQPIMGYNYGAGNFDRLKGTLFRAMAYSTVFGVAMWVCVETWAPVFVSVFLTGEPEVEALAAHALRLFFVCMPFIPVGVCGGGLFQACGKPVRSALLSLSRQVIFFIPCLLILPSFFGLDGCWLAGAISDVCAFVMTIVFVFFGLRSIRKELDEKRVGNLVS